MSRLRLAALAGRRSHAVLQAAAAAASGVLLASAFPGPDLGPVALVALVPLLLAAAAARPRRAAALGYLTGLVFFGLHLEWIAAFLSWTGAVAWLAWGAIAAVEALALAAFAALVAAARPLGAWRLLVLPCCWAALELARAHLPLGGFPWGLLAVSQHRGGPLLPLARVVGGYGLGAVLVAINLALAALVGQLARRGRWTGRRLAASAAAAAAAAALTGAGLLAPAPPPPSGPPLDLAIVQGGLRGGHGLDLGLTTPAVVANHVRMTAALRDGPAPDLVVWGEGAVDQDPLTTPDRLAALRAAAAAARAPLLFGATTVADPTHLATEALELTPDGRVAGRYRKRRLVPFGEYVPWGGVLGRLVPATREGVPEDKVPGRRLVLLPLDGTAVGPLICWESAYPEDARTLARDGAGVLVVLTNNASFGDGPGSRQHLASSQLRAVEEGRTVVHAAVTGISAVVGPDGAARQRTGLYQQVTVRAQVTPRAGLTPYARVGGLLEGLLVAVAAAGAAAAPLLGRRRGRPAPTPAGPAPGTVAPPGAVAAPRPGAPR